MSKTKRAVNTKQTSSKKVASKKKKVVVIKTRRIDAKEFAALLKVDRATIYKHVVSGIVPKPVTSEGKMMWDAKRVAKLAA